MYVDGIVSALAKPVLSKAVSSVGKTAVSSLTKSAASALTKTASSTALKAATGVLAKGATATATKGVVASLAAKSATSVVAKAAPALAAKAATQGVVTSIFDKAGQAVGAATSILPDVLNTYSTIEQAKLSMAAAEAPLLAPDGAATGATMQPGQPQPGNPNNVYSPALVQPTSMATPPVQNLIPDIEVGGQNITPLLLAGGAALLFIAFFYNDASPQNVRRRATRRARA